MSSLSSLGLKKISSYFPKNFFKNTPREKIPLRRYASCWRRRPKKCLRIKIRKYSTSDYSKNIIKSPLGEIVLSSMLFHEKIFENLSVWERKTAIRCGQFGRKYTYRDLQKHSKAFAGALQTKFKLQKGDTFAITLPNCPEYPIIILGASQAGIVPTTVNPTYTSYEIQRQLEDCHVKLIVTCPASYEKCFSVLQKMKISMPIIVTRISNDDIVPEGSVDLLELFSPLNADYFTPVNIDMDDIVIIPYSSGTTGGPKGVLLSHKNIVSNITQISHPETDIIRPTTRFHQDKILGVLPMFHIYGLIIGTFFSLKNGCQVVSLPKFDPVLYVKNIFRNRVCILYVVPPIIELLLHEKVKKAYMRSIEYLLIAAAPLNIELARKILVKAPHIKLCQGYGMTETSPAVAHTSTKRLQKLSSIGIPVANTMLKVADIETGQPLGMGEQGEICIFGPQVMKGYLNRPEETKKAFDSDGFLKTGDMGYYDDDGDFFVVDRLKELIKTKGFQVAPAEIEEALRTHPKIKDAAVVGVPHARFGEVPKAFIILKENTQMTEEEVKHFISQKLSQHKQLNGGVHFLNEFPRNNIGKVLKKSLTLL